MSPKSEFINKWVPSEKFMSNYDKIFPKEIFDKEDPKQMVIESIPKEISGKESTPKKSLLKRILEWFKR